MAHRLHSKIVRASPGLCKTPERPIQSTNRVGAPVHLQQMVSEPALVPVRGQWVPLRLGQHQEEPVLPLACVSGKNIEPVLTDSSQQPRNKVGPNLSTISLAGLPGTVVRCGEVLQQGDGGPAQPPEYHTPAGHPRCWEYNGTYPSPRMIPLPTMSAIHLVWVPFEISIAILFP